MLLKLKTGILWTQNKGSGNTSDKLFTSNQSPLPPSLITVLLRHSKLIQLLLLGLNYWSLQMSELMHLKSLIKFIRRFLHCVSAVSWCCFVPFVAGLGWCTAQTLQASRLLSLQSTSLVHSEIFCKTYSTDFTDLFSCSLKFPLMYLNIWTSTWWFGPNLFSV